MVRFIMAYRFLTEYENLTFTFQYGQIYYTLPKNRTPFPKNIYIPIWLDLLCGIVALIANFETDLHSNMVRFIMHSSYSKIR